MDETIPMCCWLDPITGKPCRMPADYIIIPPPADGVAWYDTYTEACVEHVDDLADDDDEIGLLPAY